MNAKAWLSRARTIDREIDALLLAKEEAFTKATKVTQQLTGMTVQSTPDPHKFDSIVEYEMKINTMIDRLYETKKEIASEIEKLTDGRYRTVLYHRYVNCMTFEKIAVYVGYSYKQVCRIHGRALLKMEDILNER